MKKNIKKQGISFGTILIIIIIFFILIKSIYFTKMQKNISSGEIQNVSSSDGITSQRGIILNVPIDSRPISRNNFEYLVKTAGYDYVEFNGYLDENELEWEIYKAGNSAAQRNEINRAFELNGEKYNKSNNTMIINGSSYFFGGLVATSDPKAYENMEIKMQDLKELVSTYNNIEYYLIFNIPRTLPDARVLEYPEGIVDETKVSGMEDYYNAEIIGTTLEKKTYFNKAVTEWLYMRYYNKVKGGDTFSTWPYYVQKFCGDFYDEYSTFLEEYVLIFEESLNYLEELLKLKQELKDVGKRDFTLIVSQNDLYISDFFTKNVEKAGSENFTMIEKYVNSQKIIKHSPTYYIESSIKNEDCILFPGVDEVNHMILARDLVKKTGKGMTFNYLNPKTNDSTISFMDYVGDYDPMSVRENLAMRESFINKFATETSNVIDTYLTYRERADSAIMTEQEAEMMAQNIYNNPKSEKIIIGVHNFDPNLTRALAKNGNIFDMTYCSEWNTVGNTLGIGLSSAVIGETLKNEAINIEDTQFLEERILNYAEYRVITVLEGLIYNPYKYPDLTKNTHLATYEEEKNDVTGKKLAERISYTGGNGNVEGEIYLIDNLLNGTNTNGERYKYSIGDFMYTVDSIDIVATRPWNRSFEVKLTPNMEISEVEKVEYKVQHYLEELDGTYSLNPDIEKFRAYPDTEVIPEPKTYEGFTCPEKQTVEIAGYGSTVVKYYYTRKTYKVTVEKGIGIESVTGEGTHKYEEEVTLSAQLKEGYKNEQWSSEPTFTMPAEDVSLEVSATPITYTIKYNLNGGSVTGNPETYTVESENIILKQPIKKYYEFIGWTGSNGNTVQKEVVIEKGTTGNKEYIANWKQVDTTYKVEHYRQALNGEYPETLKETETLNGYSGTSVTPEVKEYEGFTCPEKQIVEIAGDGSTVVKYYYKRKTYKVTVEKGKGIESVTGEGTHKYEEEVTLSAQLKEGYENEQWSSEPTFTMPAEEVSLEVSATPITYTIKYNLNGGSVTGNPQTYTVESENIILKQPIKQHYEFIGWTGSNGNTVQKEVVIEKGTTGNKEYIANWEQVDTTYKVEHYRQALNGEYPEMLKETETLNGYSGTRVTPEVKEYEGFTCPEKQTVEIAGDGSTVVKYYYKRNTYTLTVKKGDGIDSIQKSETYKFEENVVLKAILQKGYKDINWDWNIDLGENIETKEYDNTTSVLEFLMPANNDIEILVYAIPKDDILISESLVVDEQKLIVENIHPDTTEQEIREVLKCEMEFEIIDEKGVKILQTSLIGTGYKIKLENDKIYTLIVKGDINSDGKANIKDILGINKHRLNKVKLTEEYLLAADVNKDEKVNIRDILKINKFRLGKINQL